MNRRRPQVKVQTGTAVRLDDQVVALASAVAQETGTTAATIANLGMSAGLGDLDTAETLARLRDARTRLTPTTLAASLTRLGMTGERVLAVRLGAWKPQEESDPMGRTGYGWKPQMTQAELAGSTLGYWRLDRVHLPRTRHVVGYRLGRCAAPYRVDSEG